MDRRTGHILPELGEAIERGFPGAPVEAAPPIGDEGAKKLGRGSAIPGRTVNFGRDDL